MIKVRAGKSRGVCVCVCVCSVGHIVSLVVDKAPVHPPLFLYLQTDNQGGASAVVYPSCPHDFNGRSVHMACLAGSLTGSTCCT